MKKTLYSILIICFLISSSSVFADSTPSNAPLSENDMRAFRLTSNEIQSAHVKWGPGLQWTLTRNEIESLIKILRTARKEDIKPYYGPMPKGGPFSVTLTTKQNEKFSFMVGVGGKGYILCPGGKVFLPTFQDFMEPFKIRRVNEMDMRRAVEGIFN